MQCVQAQRARDGGGTSPPPACLARRRLGCGGRRRTRGGKFASPQRNLMATSRPDPDVHRRPAARKYVIARWTARLVASTPRVPRRTKTLSTITRTLTHRQPLISRTTRRDAHLVDTRDGATSLAAWPAPGWHSSPSARMCSSKLVPLLATAGVRELTAKACTHTHMQSGQNQWTSSGPGAKKALAPAC